MRLPHRGRDMLVVFHQFAQHLAWRHIVVVIVLDGLVLADVADRPQRDAAELAHPFGQLVGGGEDRIRLFVEHDVIVMEVSAADMPVKILGLHIERKGIGQ
jgi:hypothetical protein